MSDKHWFTGEMKCQGFLKAKNAEKNNLPPNQCNRQNPWESCSVLMQHFVAILDFIYFFIYWGNFLSPFLSLYRILSNGA